VADVADVAEAYMEGDGRISVIARDANHRGAQDRRLV
jgi:uncharacterized membrane protein YcaP (DUF421 family)